MISPPDAIMRFLTIISISLLFAIRPAAVAADVHDGGPGERLLPKPVMMD
jgi:hypothetical protein